MQTTIATAARGLSWLVVAGALVGCGSAPASDTERLGVVAEPLAADVDPQCVEPGRYEVADDVATDTQGAGLLWQRQLPPAGYHTQAEAVTYCQGLTLGGMSGWRLPSPQELGGLRYKAAGLGGGAGHDHHCSPSIDQQAFPGTPAEPFWTSRTASDGTAWYVGFADGRTQRNVPDDLLLVRCAHDPVATP